LIGPPSTKSTFDNDVYIYIERKTSSKLVKLGKKKLIKNDVLVLEIDNKGILLAKNFTIKMI
jgi:outer membrane protein assembly factor BamE (lipoprotein component of BamABCDE complex)